MQPRCSRRVLAIGLALCAGLAGAQNYPNRAIRVITAEAGGGAIVNRGGLLIAADADDDWIHVCGTESGDSTRTADDAYARVRTRLK